MQKQTFNIRDILAAFTGFLSAGYDEPGGMSGVYKVLDFMSQDSNSTFQLPRVATEVKPYLAEQLSWLKTVDSSQWENNLPKILADVAVLEAQHGTTLALFPMHLEDHAHPSPEDELRDMGFKGQIISVEQQDDEPSPYGDLPQKS